MTFDAATPAAFPARGPAAWWIVKAAQNREARAHGYRGEDMTPCRHVGGSTYAPHIQPCACDRCTGGRYRWLR